MKRFFGFLVFLSTFLNISCHNDISFSHIPPKALISRVDTGEPDKLIRNANTILKGYINLGDGWSSVKYEGELDWKADPYKNSSWKNYFYSLRMIGILSQAYNINENTEYLKKGKEILVSWDSNYNKDELLEQNYRFVWGDHAVANRVINLVHFYNSLKKANSLDQMTEEVLKKHLKEYGNWLADDNNYTKGNHAVMMDRALLYLSYVINSEFSGQWRDKAILRFNLILKEEVTSEGVCTENSPQYHPFMMDLIQNFISIQENFGDQPNQLHTEIYESMKTYLVHVLKPDLTYPFQGDTYPVTKPLQYSEKYHDPRFKYLESKGEKGERPKQTDIIFKEAGYAILRDEWRTANAFEKMTYLNFISGIPSRVHKHSDNLSFFMYSNGEDLLIDPGSWGYAQNDTVSYLKSTLAHNTFLINHSNITDFPVRGSNIIDSELEENYAIIKGTFTPNPYQKYYRTLFYIKPNILLLDDEVFSEIEIESVSQIFNLGTNMKSLDINRENNTIEAEFENNRLIIAQLLNDNYKVDYFNGSQGLRGLYAERAEKTRSGNQIVFHGNPGKAVNKFRNITLIRIENDNDWNVTELDINEQEHGFVLTWLDKNGKEHNITLSKKGYEDTDYFLRNLENADSYSIALKKSIPDFDLKEFYVHEWTKGEYSFIFKLNDDATLQEIKKYTLGIRGYAYDEDKMNLSTYSRQTNRDFDSWNLKAEEIIETDYGKFININISTNLNKFRKIKLFLFDRGGYKTELWNHEIEDFFLDKEHKTRLLLNEAISVNKKPEKFTESLGIEDISVVQQENGITFLFRLNNGMSEEEIEKIKIGFHTYVAEEDKDRLMAYSQAKSRIYDAWDFVPEITIIDNKKYIVKTITTPIIYFPKVRLFLYDRYGYKGMIGKAIEIEDLKIGK